MGDRPGTLVPVIPRVLRLAPLLLLAACASPGRPPAADGVPADFRLQVVSAGATNPHCDFDVTVGAAGGLAYAVSHRGAKVGDRRGREEIPAAAVLDLLRAVEAAGFPELPSLLPPEPGGGERGVVTFRIRLRGRERTVVADHAGTRGTDGVLSALFRAVPLRLWRVPGAE